MPSGENVNSLDLTPAEGRDTRWVTRLAGIYLVLLYVAACAIISVFGYVRRDRIPGVRNYFPSPVPSPTSAPHILLHPPSAQANVLTDYFDSDQNNWNSIGMFSKVEVVNGRLLLQSNEPGRFGIARIGDQAHIVPDEKYYLQADLTTDVSTEHPYGLAFGLNKTTYDFYLFEVTPLTRGYRLMSYTGGGWKELMMDRYGKVRPYPASNTLSVYYDQGTIELSLNGGAVLTYHDPAQQLPGIFGTYVDDAGFTLIADNFLPIRISRQPQNPDGGAPTDAK